MKSPLVVKRGTHGLGLFTTVTFKKGDFVIEYTGEKITETEANMRGGQYLFELNKAFVIDGKDRQNHARYINHSCRPNCYPEIDDVEEHIMIFAKRSIAAGEELTYNYGPAFFNTHVKSKGCRCIKCTQKRERTAASANSK